MNVLPKTAKDKFRLAIAPSGKREALERDHRIAAPIGEPVVAGDDGANFLTDGLCANCICDATHRHYQELVCREDEFSGECRSSPPQAQLVVSAVS